MSATTVTVINNETSTANDEKTKDENPPPVYVNPDFKTPFEYYVNLYHGLDIDPSKISHYADQTPEQKNIYESFLEQVRSHDFETEFEKSCQSCPLVIPDDMTCLRFLQADKYNTELAFNRLITTMQWQQEWNVAKVISNPPKKLSTYRHIRIRAYLGRSNDGMPVFIERLAGLMNGIPSKEGKSMSDEDWIHCFMYDLADVIYQIRNSYEHTTKDHPEQPTTWKATWIMDLKGVSAFRAMKALSVIKVFDSMTEPNFPELAGPIYMVNAPSIVAGVWRMTKTFLDPTLVEKIQLHAGVPKDLLLERIPQSVLLNELGGDNVVDFPKSSYA